MQLILLCTIIPVLISLVYNKSLQAEHAETVPAWRKKIDLIGWLERKYEKSLVKVLSPLRILSMYLEMYYASHVYFLVFLMKGKNVQFP